MSFTVYDIATGEVQFMLDANILSDVGRNIPEGCRAYPGRYPGTEFYFDADEIPREYPSPQPSMSHLFDRQTGTWIDPRTPADMQAALYAAREATMRDKSDLLMTLVQMRLMEAADARVAARGDIPAPYQDAFNQLPQEAQDYAMIKWPSDQVISRMNPIAQLFAFVAQIDDDQLDAAFGVQRPE